MLIFENKKQNGIFFLFFSLFFAVLFFVFPKITQATTTAPFFDNFDNYSVGDINGQGYWTTYLFGVQGGVSFVKSDFTHWVSNYNALYNNHTGFTVGTSTNELPQGSFMFYLQVLNTSIQPVSIPFLQGGNHPLETSFVFQVWLNRIDDLHFCISDIAYDCVGKEILSVSAGSLSYFYMVGVWWDVIRLKFRYFDGQWSEEIDPNVGISWFNGIVGFGINQNMPVWEIYIDDIQDNRYFPITNITTSTTPTLFKEQIYLGCEDWGLASFICKSLVYVFIPDSIYFERFAELKNIISGKPPFGYFYSVKDAIENINASSTPAFSFPEMGVIKTDIFDKLRVGLAWILWVMFAFFVIKRIGDFVP